MPAHQGLSALLLADRLFRLKNTSQEDNGLFRIAHFSNWKMGCASLGIASQSFGHKSSSGVGFLDIHHWVAARIVPATKERKMLFLAETPTPSQRATPSRIVAIPDVRLDSSVSQIY
jgi:hypothetical protein